MSTTLAQVAAAAGVSKATASNAFNRPDQVGAKVRKHVLHKASELGYRGADPFALAFRSGRTGMVGLVFRESMEFVVEDPFAHITLAALTDELAIHGLGLALLPSATLGEEGCRRALVDAIVSYRLPDNDPALSAAHARGLRVVRLGVPSDSPDDIVVSIDERVGARDVAEHLLKLGHRRLDVFLDMTESLNGADDPSDRMPFAEQRTRWEGYLEAARPFGAEVVAHAVGRNVPESGARAAHQLLDEVDRVTAIVCVTDVLALGVLKALRARGLIVGTDISVVGFDDIPDAAGSDLTTVRQPIAERARVAARLLIDSTRTPKDAQLNCSLVVRGSSGTPSSNLF